MIAFIASCKNNNLQRPDKPNDLIPEAKMVEVLYDMSLISAAKGVNKRVIENKGIHPEAYIFNKHNIDSAQFAASNAYYSYNLETYEALYAKVKQRLENDKKVFNRILAEEKKVRDSLSEIQRLKRDSIRKNAEGPGLLKKRDTSPQ